MSEVEITVKVSVREKVRNIIGRPSRREYKLASHERKDLALFFMVHLLAGSEFNRTELFEMVVDMDPGVLSRYHNKTGRDLTPNVVAQRFDKGWRYGEFKNYWDELMPVAIAIVRKYVDE